MCRGLENWVFSRYFREILGIVVIILKLFYMWFLNLYYGNILININVSIWWGIVMLNDIYMGLWWL